MRTLVGSVALLAVLAAGCAAANPRRVTLPAPVESRGVRVEVETLIVNTTRCIGVRGWITDVGGDGVYECTVTFEGLSAVGDVLGHARARIGPIPPGETLPFDAHFPKPVINLDALMSPRLDVRLHGPSGGAVLDGDG